MTSGAHPAGVDVLPSPAPRYWITRFVFLRLLGIVYFFAFLGAAHELLPLVGAHGLSPLGAFLDRVREAAGDAAPLRVPTLFWLTSSDAALRAAAWTGVALSLLVAAGLANAPLLLALWALYASIVHAGQRFWGYGWELLLVETGFLAVFLVPTGRWRPFTAAAPPPVAVLWLLRWVLFRLMLGAGLIKLRGDPCWRDLTCLLHHLETQPVPHPLSWLLHQAPPAIHAVGVVFTLVVELGAPWLLFAPRRFRHAGGAALALFQILLILSGNLAFLNWLTLALCVTAFDDGPLGALLPPLRARSGALEGTWTASRARVVAVTLLGIAVGVLSVNPVRNLLSPRQVMNTTHDPLYLVNSYGMFGTVGQERYEVILEGTRDTDPATAAWVEYELPCKPGDPARRPCVSAPYHRRLDWQLWFAALSRADREPWFIHLVAKLLDADPGTLSLFERDPFGGARPRFVRALFFRYEFTRPGEPGWWRRTLVGEYLPPLARDDARLIAYLRSHGWAQ